MNCEDCGKFFSSRKGINVHKARFCYGKVPRLDNDSTFRDAAFFVLSQREARVDGNHEYNGEDKAENEEEEEEEPSLSADYEYNDETFLQN